MSLQVLTVAGNHIVYKAPPDDAGLHSVVTPSAATNATCAADFAARVPVAALHVKVCFGLKRLHMPPSA